MWSGYFLTLQRCGHINHTSVSSLQKHKTYLEFILQNRAQTVYFLFYAKNVYFFISKHCSFSIAYVCGFM